MRAIAQRPGSMPARLTLPLLLTALWVLPTSALAADVDAERLAAQPQGRSALRDMDCARCHGRDYDGWAAPSLIAAVRDGPRERFDRMVLEGDIVRGMPSYKSQPRVVAELDAIYAYLRARAADSAAAPRPASER
jgi:cytochrome c55X